MKRILNILAEITKCSLLVIIGLMLVVSISTFINSVHIYIDNQNHIIEQLNQNIERLSRNLFKENIDKIISANVGIINFTDFSGGSGIFIDTNIILTAKHLIDKETDILIIQKDSLFTPAKIIKVYKDRDLMILKLYTDTPFPYVNISKFEPKIADEVYAVGNPVGEIDQVTFGLIRKQSKENEIYHSATIAPGNSGGGLFNKDGELVGINIAMIVVSENIYSNHWMGNFALATDIISIREDILEVIRKENNPTLDDIMDKYKIGKD